MTNTEPILKFEPFEVKVAYKGNRLVYQYCPKTYLPSIEVIEPNRNPRKTLQKLAQKIVHGRRPVRIFTLGQESLDKIAGEYRPLNTKEVRTLASFCRSLSNSEE